MALDLQLDSGESCSVRNIEDLRELLSSSKPLEKLLAIDRSSAPFVVELLYKELQEPAQVHISRKHCLWYLKAMGKRFHVLPSSIFMNDIIQNGCYPLRGGGFADIYMGNANGTDVCLKVLRVHTAESEEKRQKVISNCCEEVLMWTQLRHANVLPLLGVNTKLFPTTLCLVSPWMANGDIVSFLKVNPNHDRVKSISEIIAGLEYLHSLSPAIIHGDIKGANILVSEDHRCLLADFGLAAINQATLTMIYATGDSIKGSLRWMAPEMYARRPGVSVEQIMSGDRRPHDIYAFACTVLELLTGKPPFFNLTDPAVMFEVIFYDKRPERPSEGWCPDHIWKLVELCWDKDPYKRPQARELHKYIQCLMLSGNRVPGESGFIGYFHSERPTRQVSDETTVTEEHLAGPKTSFVGVQQSDMDQNRLMGPHIKVVSTSCDVTAPSKERSDHQSSTRGMKIIRSRLQACRDRERPQINVLMAPAALEAVVEIPDLTSYTNDLVNTRTIHQTSRMSNNVVKTRKTSLGHLSEPNFMTKLSHTLHEVNVGYKKARKWWRIGKGKKAPPGRDTNGTMETSNFQDSQMYSHRPLDMDARLVL